MSRADFGEEWPLTVDAGTLRCEGAGAVYFEANGTTYAVNGTARQESPDAPKIDAIWRDDPSGAGLKMNLGPLIDRGLELCE